MRPYSIALLAATACIAGPAPLVAQDRATDEAMDFAFTPMLEYALYPFPFLWASIRLSTVRGEMEAPTVSAGVFMGGDGSMGWVSLGIGVNRMVLGPFYVGAEGGLLFRSRSRPIWTAIPTAHVRLGAPLDDIGTVAEIRAGLIADLPILTVALGFRF